MATDSATLDRRVTTARRASDGPKIRSPADPIARGMGLNRPFFEDKNRAFWMLQSIGWSGYFFLRTLSGIANNLGWMLLVHTLLLTATGYSLTLLMASLFRRLIQMRPLWTLVLSLGAVVIAAGVFSVIETWSVATFLKPSSSPKGSPISARCSSTSLCSRRGRRSITGSTISSCWRTRSACASGWRARLRPRSWRCCAIS